MKTITIGAGAAVALSASIAVIGAQQAPAIPLRTGLTVVTAIHQDVGDFESIKRVTAVNNENIELSYSAEVPESEDLAQLIGAKPNAGKVRHLRVNRTIRRRDLLDAHEYANSFSDHAKAPRLLPGTTAIGVSKAVLTDLKTKGSTSLTAYAPGQGNAIAGFIGSLLGSKDVDEPEKISGTLKRVEAQPVRIPVLVNDERVMLPAIHARGKLEDEDAEFFFLDDADNPLSLRWTIGDDRLNVIKIAFPLESPATPTAPAAGGGRGTSSAAPQIERALEKTGRAEVYGIFFDFASARIKEESEPVLSEIAAVMTKNPTWTLSVEGHTDNIGGDAYNIDLSKKRAAAVKDALVNRFHIVAARLSTAGLGAGRPKDTNDTLEGRARNRRVELVRG